MPQLSKKIPYLDTSITALESRIDIEGMLNEAGIKDTRWTNVSGESVLEFVWHFEDKGVKKSVAFKLRPPAIEIRRRRFKDNRGRYNRGEFINVRAENAEWRLLWWYVKSRLEAVRFGLESMEQTFMSQVIVSLPNGKTTTVGEILSEAIKNDQTTALKALPGMIDFVPTSEWNKPKKVIEISESGEVVGQDNS